MLLWYFWICGYLARILNKFALEAVLHSFGTSEFGILLDISCLTLKEGRKLKTEGYFLREQLS